MKKILSCLLAVFLLTTGLSACGNQTSPASTSGSETNSTDKLSIVATTFPQYDWVRHILGDKADDAELTLLLDNGVDLHSYQPTVEDIAKISTCDLFIYVGGESDAWVQDALATATNKDMLVVNMVEVLGDKVKEEIIEGMEHNHDHSHGEFHPEDVEDRPLSDWQGQWQTIENALESGAMDSFVSHKAEENELTFDEQKAAYTKRWKSDYANLSITDTTVDFAGVAAGYQSIGYKLLETDHGTSVWYGFEADSNTGNVPRYLAFCDHEIKSHQGHEEERDHEHEETPHFHMRYGNKSFDALLAIENWAPTYFAADLSDKKMADAMGGHSHTDGHETDEHVWLSLKNAQVICSHITAELGKLDTANADTYQANWKAYNKNLSNLDANYQKVVQNAPVKTLLFGDRFPFRYLVDDYGLSYYAAFSGCSAETEASFETVVFLSQKVDELGLNHVMVIDGSNRTIAETIIANTSKKNQSILVLDSMQSVAAQDIATGATYLSIMESNLNALREALS